MAKWQFSLKLLIGAVTCFAVAFAAWSHAINYKGDKIFYDVAVACLSFVLCGLAVFVLTDTGWIGVLAGFLLFLITLIDVAPQRQPKPLVPVQIPPVKGAPAATSLDGPSSGSDGPSDQ